MSKPKNMTPEQEAEWKAKIRAYQKAYQDSNREKINARNRAFHKANRDKIKACREANLEKYLAREKASREANREKRLADEKARRESLADGYVADRLRIPIAECPPELIEMKRQQLLIHRSIKQLNQKLEKQNGNQ